MYLKIVKNVVALSWISAVIYYYFTNHAYFKGSWLSFEKWVFFILLIPLTYGCYALYKWFNNDQTILRFKLTALRIVAILGILIYIMGNFAFYVVSPSFYTGDNLFYDQSEEELVMVADTSVIEDDQTLIAVSQSSLEGTRESFDWIPQELQKYFVMPTFWDIQFGLITKSVAIILILSLITLVTMSIGNTLLKFLIKKNELDKETLIISLGLGLAITAIITFILASVGQYNQVATVTAFIIFTAISWKSSFEILKKTFKYEYIAETKALNFSLLTLAILAVAISANFIDNISPLPRGWDGMNQYVNIAKRVSESGSLIQTGGVYYWELITNLGFVMFDWITIALNLTGFYPSLIALVALYILIRKYSSFGSTLMAIAAIYLTPMMLFHSAEDNKVDLAHLAIGTISIISFIKALNSSDKREKLVYLGIAGALLGFCFGIKITSMMLIMTLFVILLYKEFKISGLISGIMLAIGLFITQGTVNIGSDYGITGEYAQIIGLALAGISLIPLIIKFITDRSSIKKLTFPGIMVATSLLVFMPWMIKNYTENHSLNPGLLVGGKSAQPTIDYQMLEEEYGLDRDLCENTGLHEEMDRYIGYSPIVQRIITLPWHLTMNDDGVSGIYVDIGWIFLALIPGLILFVKRDHFKNHEVKLLAMGTAIYWFIWLITANGVIWYGISGFALLALLVAVLTDNYEKDFKFGNKAIKIIVTIFLISSLMFRLDNLGKATLLLYTADTVNKDQAITSIFTYALDVHDLFETDQDGQNDLIWKVGTALNYYIEDNFWRTYNDQYLDDFNCLYIERDPDLLTTRLKALGYGYIIFDYYTYSLSPDPESTLRAKYDAALDYILNYTDIVIPDYFRGHLVVKLR